MSKYFENLKKREITKEDLVGVVLDLLTGKTSDAQSISKKFDLSEERSEEIEYMFLQVLRDELKEMG